MGSSRTTQAVWAQSDETPGSNCARSATGEERGFNNSPHQNNDLTLNPSGGLGSDDTCARRQEPSFVKLHVVGTWNVRSRSQGKWPIVKSEMERKGVQLLGICELKWTGRGHFQSGSMKKFYSRDETHRRDGAAFVLQEDQAGCVLGYNAVNDRIL